MDSAAIVLAAGAGTRMKSKRPKVAHEILGKSLVNWVIDSAHAAGIDRVVTVVGHERQQVIPLVEEVSQVVVQESQRGTGDAVMVCKDALADFDGSIIVLSGDSPLITSQTISEIINKQQTNKAACVVLSMNLANPFGYGRILRSGDAVIGIVEEKDATEEQKQVNECNSGIYCFDAKFLFEALSHIDCDNAQGEYYLPDVVALAVNEGLSVEAVTTSRPEECLGVNSRLQLAEASKVAQQRINRVHMENGVTFIDPDQSWIGPEVVIERDVIIYPQVFLFGQTTVGEDTVIGPNSRLVDTTVGKACHIDESILLESTLENDVSCGPRAYLRPGAYMCAGSKAGTHVEIKKSHIGKNSKVPHLSYIGDTIMGEDVNIGAGSITCNFDGKHKHQTRIGDGAFIGSDTMMVAPVEIGHGAVIGAASCIAGDIPADALGLTRPALVVQEGWAADRRKRMEKE